MLSLVDGDASSSVGVAFTFLVSFLSDSENDTPALRLFGFRDDREGGVLNGSILGGGEFLSDGDIENKP